MGVCIACWRKRCCHLILSLSLGSPNFDAEIQVCKVSCGTKGASMQANSKEKKKLKKQINKRSTEFFLFYHLVTAGIFVDVSGRLYWVMYTLSCQLNPGFRLGSVHISFLFYWSNAVVLEIDWRVWTAFMLAVRWLRLLWPHCFSYCDHLLPSGSADTSTWLIEESARVWESFFCWCSPLLLLLLFVPVFSFKGHREYCKDKARGLIWIWWLWSSSLHCGT